jgi:hypothetical protein
MADRRILCAVLQLCATIFFAGTGSSGADPDQKNADGQQRFVREALLNPLGISEPLVFDVPRNARSLTVTVVGEPAQIYALASLRTADGVEHVGWDEKKPPGPALDYFYRQEHLCHFPGRLRQCPRLGTYTLIYPNRPDQKLPAGATSLRVSSEKAGSAHVHFFLSETSKANFLHLNFFTVSRQAAPVDTKRLARNIQGIFDQAEIQIVIDNAVALPDSSFSDLTNLAAPKLRPSGAPTDPEETPDGGPAKLALLGHQRLPLSSALNIYLVDSFGGRGVKALSLGTPGPPLPSSYYFGVFVERSSDYDAMARLSAHEIAHFLGLDHPTRWSASDAIYRDGLVSSAEIVINLMGSGSELTAAQVNVMMRSPLLKPN